MKYLCAGYVKQVEGKNLYSHTR